GRAPACGEVWRARPGLARSHLGVRGRRARRLAARGRAAARRGQARRRARSAAIRAPGSRERRPRRGYHAAMKIAVMGAGAVGCYYGAMLARAGNEVVMIGRQPHVEAMRAKGLVLETASFTEAVRVEATTKASGVAGAKLVLFCVKSTDTESAGAAMAP